MFGAARPRATICVHMGYDVMKGEYVDMLESGIIDPAKVTKGAPAQCRVCGRDGAQRNEALITASGAREAGAAPAPGGGGGMY